MSDLDHLNRKIFTLATLVESKDILIQKSQARLQKIISESDGNGIADLKEINEELKKGLEYNFEFDLMKLHFEDVHPNFYSELQKRSISLTNKDLRLAALLKMNLNNSEIAYLLNISLPGIKKSIQRFKKKMELAPGENLRKLIMTIGD